ncbi:hypothetical protein ACROYT_G038092 [Oculina patagonica]
MERRNSYSRSIYAPTAAARIADARNKRETLLLAEASKGFSNKTEGTIRTFYREKAKANSFLQKVRHRSSGMLIATSDEHSELVENRKTVLNTENQTRINLMKDQRARRWSMDIIDQADEMQKRIQKFMSQDFLGSQSRNEHDEQLNQENTKDKLELKDFSPLLPEISENDSKTNATSSTPFKVHFVYERENQF